MHLNDPGRLRHLALTPQTAAPPPHSLMSVHSVCGSPEYPEGQTHWYEPGLLTQSAPYPHSENGLAVTGAAEFVPLGQLHSSTSDRLALC